MTQSDLGFKLNPYYRCMVNKLINVKYFTIMFRADNDKLSCTELKVLSDVIDKIVHHFRELDVARCNAHEFLGINVKIRKEGLVAIHRCGKVEGSLENF